MSTASTHIDNKPSLRASHCEDEGRSKLKQSHQCVPALRFKEFERDIVQYLFENIFIFSTGKNIKQAEASPEFETPCVRYGELYHMYGEVIKEVINKTNLDTSELLFSKGDEILLPSAGEDPLDIGSASALTLENVAIGRTINILRPQEENSYSQIFASYYINEKLRKKISTLARGASISNVYNSDLKKLKINLPALPEQQKIASFLAAVDEKIQQLTKKKALLEDYKKGVMQQLFSGQLRFKDENGNDYPDWEEKLFSDLYSFHSTNSLSRDKLNYDAGSVYNIHYGDIHTKFKTAFNLNEAYIPFVNDDVDLSKIKTDSYCNNGDLVMADASEDYADIGKTIELIDLKDENVLAGLHTFLARPITSKTTIGFFSVLLKSWSMRKQIMVIAQGTKVLSLSTTRVGKLKLKLPIIEEQQKIATYVSRIDTKIAAVTHQITQTQTFKKGLLQGMFV
jgi:type I restriction enzyme S subunit